MELDAPGLMGALGADIGMSVRLRRDTAGQQDLERSVLVTIEASRLALGGGPWSAGRPPTVHTNLHLDLVAPPFAEEPWEGGQLQVGAVTLVLLHPCPRCVIPTRSTDGQVRWPELLRHLHRIRNGLFGINARVLVPGRVAVSDRATVAEPPARA